MKKHTLIHDILLEYASTFGYEVENYSIIPIKNGSLYHGSFSRLPVGPAGPIQYFRWAYYNNDTFIRLCKQNKNGLSWEKALLVNLSDPDSLNLIHRYFSDTT